MAAVVTIDYRIDLPRAEEVARPYLEALERGEPVDMDELGALLLKCVRIQNVTSGKARRG